MNEETQQSTGSWEAITVGLFRTSSSSFHSCTETVLPFGHKYWNAPPTPRFKLETKNIPLKKVTTQVWEICQHNPEPDIKTHKYHFGFCDRLTHPQVSKWSLEPVRQWHGQRRGWGMDQSQSRRGQVAALISQVITEMLFTNVWKKGMQTAAVARSGARVSTQRVWSQLASFVFTLVQIQRRYWGDYPVQDNQWKFISCFPLVFPIIHPDHGG